jgi:hypothetical protein
MVVLVLVALVFVGLLLYAMRMPAVRGMLKCQSNLMEVGGALRRYADLHGSYPRDLSAIEKDYLKDPSVLRCPLDRNSGGVSSYIYHPPGPNAKGDFVVLVCTRHRFSRDTPATQLVYLKKGVVHARIVEPKSGGSNRRGKGAESRAPVERSSN